MSATQPVGGVTTRHEFVVNGRIKAFISAEPFVQARDKHIHSSTQWARSRQSPRNNGWSRSLERSVSPIKSHTTF